MCTKEIVSNNKQGCKYCTSESGFYDDVEYIDYEKEDYHFIRMDECGIIVDCRDAIDTYIGVNFCPMCGRKLKAE